MANTIESSNTSDAKDYTPHHVMEPGPLADRKLTGTWKDYVSVTKVGIIVANLMTVIAGMWLAAGGASGFFDLSPFLIVFTILGTSLIIASGTCLNNYYDRDIDQKMDRTKQRALVEGKLDPQNVLLMGIIFALIGTVLLLLVDVIATAVALFGLFGYAVVYTMWTKRKHHINTIVGSVPGAVPPMIGWAAVTGSLDAGAWVLFLIMFLWQPPHFLALAIRRCEDYRAAGIPMLPVVKGFHFTKKLMVMYIAVLIPASLYLLLVIPDLGLVYFWLALVLGISWLVIAMRGFYIDKKDDIKWARNTFLFSLVYLMVLFFAMMIITIW